MSYLRLVFDREKPLKLFMTMGSIPNINSEY